MTQQNEMLKQMAHMAINEALANIDQCKQMIQFANDEIESMTDEDKQTHRYTFQNYRLELYTKTLQELQTKIESIKANYKTITGESL